MVKIGDWPNWEMDNLLVTDSTISMDEDSCSLHGRTADSVVVTVRDCVVDRSAFREGRVVTWFRFHEAHPSMWIVFRYRDDDNWYGVHLAPGEEEIIFGKSVAGVVTYINKAAWDFALDTWYKVRVTWWSDETWGLVVNVEKWEGGEWVYLLQEVYDAANLWNLTGGRTGFYHMADNHWIDDSIMEGVTPIAPPSLTKIFEEPWTS